MKIVLGIEGSGQDAALQLIKRLRFATPCVDLTHVIPPSPWSPSGIYGGVAMEAMVTYEDYADAANQERDSAAALLKDAAAQFKDEDANCTISVLNGNPTDQILEHADVADADLIAVNAAHEGPLMSFLTGSVSRGLVIGARKSVLLGRGATGRPLRAVLATDHSPYMDRCIEQLLRFRPRGLQHVTVLTSFPQKDIEAMRSYFPHLAVNPVDAMEHELESWNQSVIRDLKQGFAPLGTTFGSWVSGEPVDLAIARAMEETEADLLILGAQGHSFLQRLTVGSVSLQQAMTARYSVLVLRVERTAMEMSHAPAAIKNQMLAPA